MVVVVLVVVVKVRFGVGLSVSQQTKHCEPCLQGRALKGKWGELMEVGVLASTSHAAGRKPLWSGCSSCWLSVFDFAHSPG